MSNLLDNLIDPQSAFTVALVVVAIGYLILRTVRFVHKARSSDKSNACGGCAGDCSASTSSTPQPLVTLDVTGVSRHARG
ncbi:MAG: hypothetical protein MPJ50_04875 [Pirellulales bacterium]|nr:hypothetical protein [Pirellulales bacterium]